MALSWKKIVLLGLAFSLAAVLLVSSANAQTTDGILIVSNTEDLAVVGVTGIGFDPTQPITLNVYNNIGNPLGSFPGPTTDSTGSFEFNLTLPYITQTGIYTFIANTSTISGRVDHILFSQANPRPVPTATAGVAAITVVPDNGNIFNVTGIWFDASRRVTLKLNNAAGLTAYFFPENVTTDAQGRFSAILIVPTTLSGRFNLIASTTTRGTGNYTVTVPSLQGPAGTAGSSGVPGVSGVPGASGEPGTAGAASSAGTDLGYVGVALGIVAIAIAGFALFKGRRAETVPKP
jgi:hypothetical protein